MRRPRLEERRPRLGRSEKERVVHETWLRRGRSRGFMLVNVGLHVDDPQFLQGEKEEREGGRT